MKVACAQPRQSPHQGSARTLRATQETEHHRPPQAARSLQSPAISSAKPSALTSRFLEPATRSCGLGEWSLPRYAARDRRSRPQGHALVHSLVARDAFPGTCMTLLFKAQSVRTSSERIVVVIDIVATIFCCTVSLSHFLTNIPPIIPFFFNCTR